MTLRERLDGWVNPIMVKELRQAVRGRFIVTVLSLLLLAQVAAVAVFLITNSVTYRGGMAAPPGQQTFTALFYVLFTATVFFIPLYSGIRMAVERSDTNVDLLFVTTIRPRTIVFGKLMTTVLLTALVFFASLPFLVFSYVLRGIDVLTMLFVLGIAFGIVCSAAIVALFLACVPASKPFKLLLAAGFLGLTFLSFAAMGGMLQTIIRSSTSMMFSAGFFWNRLMTGVLFVAAIDAVLLVVTTTLITPPAANRALPIRAMMTAVWVLSLAAAVRVMFRGRDADVMVVWAVVQMVLITLVLCSAVGERERWGPRVARTIPESLPKRVVAFLFYSGGGGGTLWAMIFYAATIVAYEVALGRRDARWASVEIKPGTRVFLEAALCLLAYALTALALRRSTLKRVPVRATWGIALVLFIIFAVVPPLVFLAGFNDTATLKENYHRATLLNPFPRLDNEADPLRGVFLAAWALMVFALSVPWIAAQWRAFRRHGTADDDDEALALQEMEAP